MRTTKSTSKIFAMMAAAGLMVGFSSCSNDDETVDNNQPQAVCFSADIANQALPGGAPGTRAAGTDWAAGDAIGIFMVGNGTTTIAEGAENKQYTTTGTSAFSPVSGDEIYYPTTGSVDFMAYYPWNTGYTLGTAIPVEIGTQTSQPAFDLLWAKATGVAGAGYDKNTTTVPLVFDHKLSKIVMNVTLGAGVSGTISDVTIKGMNTKNTFDLAAGTLGTADTPANITPREVTANSEYDAIIMPETYAAGVVTVDFTVAGATYTWTLAAETFAPGNEYTYAVTISKGGVSATGTITPWTPNDKGGVIAEETLSAAHETNRIVLTFLQKTGAASALPVFYMNQTE